MASSERPIITILVSVASTLLAGTIIYFTTNWWPSVRDWFVSVSNSLWHFLLSGHAIPGWLLVILVSATMLLLLGGIVVLLAPKVPRWTDYKKDIFFGIMWRWDYIGGEIQHAVPFCVHCDIQLVPLRDTEYSPLGLRGVTHFVCDHCRQTTLKIDGPLDQIEDNVKRPWRQHSGSVF